MYEDWSPASDPDVLRERLEKATGQLSGLRRDTALADVPDGILEHMRADAEELKRRADEIRANARERKGPTPRDWSVRVNRSNDRARELDHVVTRATFEICRADNAKRRKREVEELYRQNALGNLSKMATALAEVVRLVESPPPALPDVPAPCRHYGAIELESMSDAQLASAKSLMLDDNRYAASKLREYEEWEHAIRALESMADSAPMRRALEIAQANRKKVNDTDAEFKAIDAEIKRRAALPPEPDDTPTADTIRELREAIADLRAQVRT